MKVTFVYPDLIGSADYKGIFYTGIASLSAFLEEKGYKTSLIHVVQPIKDETLLSLFREHDADLYAFSCTANMFPYVKKCSQILKKNIDKPIVVGGVYPTLCPEEVVSEPTIDFVCRGEGEFPLSELCDALGNGRVLENIQNIWRRNEQGNVFKNKMRPLIDNLDSLPFPNRNVFDNYSKLMNERENFTSFMASRGCPYQCTYCCNHALKDTMKGLGRYVRFRSVENVIKEIKTVLNRYAFIKEISFEDDILPLKKNWFEEFAERYRKEIGVPFRCNARPNILNEVVIKSLKYAGCRQVDIGIESGSEYIRNEILNRNISDKQIFSAALLCRENNIALFTFNMLGVPFETVKDMLDTIKINAKIGSNYSQTTIFYPYKKTKLHQVCVEEELISRKELKDYFMDSHLNYNSLTLNNIRFFTYNFRTLVLFYSLIYRLKDRRRLISEKIMDSFLISPLTGHLLFPFFNRLYEFVRCNKLSARVGHFIKRTIRQHKRKRQSNR